MDPHNPRFWIGLVAVAAGAVVAIIGAFRGDQVMVTIGLTSAGGGGIAAGGTRRDPKP